MERTIINSEESLEKAIRETREAQEKYSHFTQEQVDAIFKACAIAGNKNRIKLAKLAVEDTKMGVIEDKVIKNHVASEYIYNQYKNVKTCGIVEEDKAAGIKTVLEPLGVIAAIIPTTNPTSTVIFKCLVALKTRNAIIISPHPRAKKSTIETAKIILEAAVKAGAPEGIITWIDEPSLELSNLVMKSCDTILATGGPGMVQAAYSSGKPAIGVGAGNVPAIIDDSADISLAVNSIIHSKIFDNGMICASEQSVIVHKNIYEQVKEEFRRRGCYFLNDYEKEKVRSTIIINGSVNAKIVGQKATKIAEYADIYVPGNTKILIAEVQSTDKSEEFAREKLSPVLAMYWAEDLDDAMNKAEALVEGGGYGHTASLFVNEQYSEDKINKFALKMKTCRLVVNTPSTFGGIGDVYNFALPASFTLGCGSWGGNSVSENVGIKHLMNYKHVATRRCNVMWLKTPSDISFGRGSIEETINEFKNQNFKKCMIVTDKFLYESGYVDRITNKLKEQNISWEVFYDVKPDPDLECANKGLEKVKEFEPDLIVAIGGGSPMDCAKIMWVLYEHPECNFEDMAMRFCDIRKRIYEFPKMGEKAKLVCIPTSAGTGSEVTPFSVITDNTNGVKYPLADYELLPTIAIVDPSVTDKSPKGLTAATGIDALVHAIEAVVSMMSSDFTDPLAIKAIKLIFEYLPRAYNNGEDDKEARDKMAIAANMAGIAFSNAMLGICHSLAHKLGAYHHIPHGIANALLLTEVMRYNAEEIPDKMGTYPKYSYPSTKRRYAWIAEKINLGGSNDDEKFESLIRAIEELKDKIEIKKSIREYGVEESDFLNSLNQMTEDAFDDQCTGTNPRYPLFPEIKNIYLRAYYGKEEGHEFR